MDKRKSSTPVSNLGQWPAAKKAKVTMKVVPKTAWATPSDTKNVKDGQKASSSGNKRSTKQEAKTSNAFTNQADTNNASTSKDSTNKNGTSKVNKKRLTAAQQADDDDDAYDEELDEYAVDHILDKDIELSGVTKYKVKWLGYPDDEFTWEEVHNLANSMKHVLDWEREEGQNWQLEPFPAKYSNTARDIEIEQEHRRLTEGDYRIKEKYGMANGHAWYLMERAEDGDEQVLCLKDGDAYYKKMNAEEHGHVMKSGAWDIVPNTKVPKKANGTK